MPRGLVQGQKLTQILRGLTLPVAQIQRFDDLAIPFRAVATDIVTGDRVVLDHGDLTTAMRASLSAPGVFSPVDFEGRMLVDGGLSSNLPIDVAREMDVDVLIVVDCGFPLLERNKLVSVATVTNQMLAILIRHNSAEQRKEILWHLTMAEGLERYLATRYPAQKRFSLEGGDSLIPLLEQVIQCGGLHGVEDLVFGMAHRGRLNVLVNVLGKSPEELFSEFEGKYDLKKLKGSGDVKYHKGFSCDVRTPSGPRTRTVRSPGMPSGPMIAVWSGSPARLFTGYRHSPATYSAMLVEMPGRPKV